jgi:hypothetical protein
VTLEMRTMPSAADPTGSHPHHHHKESRELTIISYILGSATYGWLDQALSLSLRSLRTPPPEAAPNSVT